ncbi:hypothetical protein DF268_33755 [Streptomyces sp. V2]|uniref:DUF6332 family protein n=1 Tax=Streptomyces niveiscabiei TaxID=164115 RepID=A0ABW9HTN3_9ACTN|nr:MULTISPECIES: DUF6332 family protein [Streptomyces]PWG09176.1 hypothetical protein DF268_33755 [Streptomyces sp. V2]QZZ31585.1 hypothetical protein A7X85_40020 [Streptomyces sp. ST1015]
MTGHGGRRTQADRDAITVEIGYALFSAGFAAAVVFGAVAGPALLFDLPGPAESLLLKAGIALAPVVFLARVISVLLKFTADRTDRPNQANPSD